jgi:tetratricopeptide (TPR) repeat protein
MAQARNVTSPSVSACLIVRNEEQNLPRALRSVADMVQQIVVTDTGSTDRTVEIAKSFSANVSHFTWCDDFSAAYNFCLDQARGNWVLLIDADEELLPESHAELDRCIKRDDALAYTVLRRDLEDLQQPETFTRMLQTRLFRNDSQLRFVGRIHHQFIVPLSEVAQQQPRQVLNSRIELRHYGYCSGLRAAKLARAARLMEMELADRPGQFYYLVELGRTWLAMGDDRGVRLLTEAAQIVVSDFPRALESGGALPMLLEHVLACDSLPRGFPLSPSEARKIAIQHFPKAIPLLWQLALREFKDGNYAASANFLETILELSRTNQYDMLVSFQSSILNGDALLNLGVCYVRQSKLKAAERCFTQLLESPDYYSRAAANLATIREMQRAR